MLRRPPLLVRLVPLFALSLAVGACGDPATPADTGVDVDTGVVDAPEPLDTDPGVCGEVAGALVGPTRSTPGGRQMTVWLEAADGAPLDAATATCIELFDPGEGELTTAAVTTGWTPPAILLVVSREGLEHGLVDSALASLPPGAMVSLWLWTDRLSPVAPLSRDPSFVAGRVTALDPLTDGASLPAQAVHTQATEAWADVGGPGFAGPRYVVMLAPEVDVLPSLLESPADVRVLWVATPDAPHRRAIDAAVAPDDALATYWTELEAAGAATLGWCDDGGGLDLAMRVLGDDIASHDIGDAAEEHKGLLCSPEQSARDGADTLSSVHIVFTDAERTDYDAHYAAPDKEIFAGAVSLRDEVGVARFEGHFRGQSSLGCVRKSYTMNLEGNDPREVIPGVGVDEFFLLSMCLDVDYVNQVNGDDLMEAIDVWWLDIGFTHLTVDGVHHGVYLYVDDPGDALHRRLPELQSVIRRRTDIDGKLPEVEWSVDDDGAAFDRYQGFLQAIVDADDATALALLDDTLDVDAYLRWIALMSLLHNGDYVDEAFFLEVATVDAGLTPTSFYRVHGWDPDDLFSECHHGGVFAIEDPHGLLYCAEAVLDHRIFAMDAVYARYVDALEDVLDQVTPEVFAATVEENAAAFAPYIASTPAREAMFQFRDDGGAPLSADAVDARLEAARDHLLTSFDARHALLRERIATYRSQP